MRISDLVRMGLRNLGRRKARTSLTIVGIVIGTISIVVMFSIGIGMNRTFEKQVMQLGSMTMITVSQYQYTYDSDGNYSGSKEQQLNQELVEKLKKLDHVKSVSAQIEGNIQANAGKYQATLWLNVMDSASFEDFGFPSLKNGATYEADPKAKKPVVWVGEGILSNYFSNPNSMRYEQHTVDPATDRITIQIQDWDLMEYDQNGELTTKPKTYTADVRVFDADEYSEYNYQAYMDTQQYEKLYTEFIKLLSTDNQKKAKKKLTNYNQIKVNADNVKNVETVQDAIREMGFESTSLSTFTKPMEQTSQMMQMVLGGVGAVAMLVAAISIANTMIMSIYERTKEIGVMKVLGCKVSDIKKLFLFEAAMMGLIGGIIGIVFSFGLSYVINHFGQQVFGALLNAGSLYGGAEEEAQISVIPFWLPLLAAGFAMMVGIVSGYYPASRATKISAIEALRNE